MSLESEGTDRRAPSAKILAAPLVRGVTITICSFRLPDYI